MPDAPSPLPIAVGLLVTHPFLLAFLILLIGRLSWKAIDPPHASHYYLIQNLGYPQTS